MTARKAGYVLLAAFLAGGLVGLAGCGKKKAGASTAEGAVKAFVTALQAGDMKTAEDLIAWNAMAKTTNPDWDTFSKSDRDLIIGKLKQQKASQLEGLASQLGGAQVGQSQAGPSGTEVAVSGPSGQMTLTAVQGDAGWKVVLPGGL